MKWLLIGVVLVVVFAIFRRMNRETTTTTLTFWQTRPELSFDEFYSQYYSSSGLDRELVRNALQMVAHATHVPATRLRPEDRIDDLKPGALNTAVALLQRIEAAGVFDTVGLPHPKDWNVDTVDAVIKFLAPYYASMRVKPT
jgi:hypothetical protein